MIECNIENINKEFLLKNNNKCLKIVIKDMDFYFKINLKNDSENLLVFSNGAIDKNKSSPPVFMRSKWGDDFNANCLFIDDRTIHNNSLKIGWGVGTIDRHYMLDYINFVNIVRKFINIEPKNTIYYGSSAGGFMSIAMASIDLNSKAIVNNPQTYVNRYNKNSVEQLYNTIFPNFSKNEIIKQFGDRLSLTNILARNKHVPKTWYIQNRLCKGDIINHFMPFCENLDKYKMDSSNINFILYNNEKDGHNPLDREQTVLFINNILNENINSIH